MRPPTIDPILQRVRDLEVPAYGDDEVTFMASVLERARPQFIFEWGTNVGASARIFYETIRRLGIECVIHTVELPDERAHEDRDHPGLRIGQCLGEPTSFADGVEHYLGGVVVQHRGDGLVIGWLLYNEFNPSRGLFYLDGDHSYAAVLNELQVISIAFPRSVILMHDTRHLESVERALADFELAHRYELERLESEAGMVALWPR